MLNSQPLSILQAELLSREQAMTEELGISSSPSSNFIKQTPVVPSKAKLNSDALTLLSSEMQWADSISLTEAHHWLETVHNGMGISF